MEWINLCMQVSCALTHVLMMMCSDFKDVFIDTKLCHANPAVNFCSHTYMKEGAKLGGKINKD